MSQLINGNFHSFFFENLPLVNSSGGSDEEVVGPPVIIRTSEFSISTKVRGQERSCNISLTSRRSSYWVSSCSWWSTLSPCSSTTGGGTTQTSTSPLSYIQQRRRRRKLRRTYLRVSVKCETCLVCVDFSLSQCFPGSRRTAAGRTAGCPRCLKLWK